MPLDFINHFKEFDHNILLLLGFALLAGTLGGRLFQKLKIPQVVGYIVLGIIIGQSGLKWLSVKTLSNMNPFNFFALGLIGFMIGGELKLNTLKKYGKQFIYILFFEALNAFIFVAIIVFGLMYITTKNLPLSLCLALLIGSISSATAAAGTTDVLWEYKAKGPLTTTLLGIVALDDVLALFLFAISSSIGSSILGLTDTNLLENILHPLYEIGGAVVVGILSGYILSKIVLHYPDYDRVLVFSIGAILFVLGFSIMTNVDMIMASMFTGFVLTNMTGKKSDEIFALVNKFAPPIYIVFFVLVGAKLNISNMNLFVLVILGGYLIGRSFGKMTGARLGAIISKAPVTVQKYLQYALFSQSGVAIGLSIIASQKYPGEIGSDILIVITASTFIVQLIGPPFVKYAVEKAGETGLNVTEEDILSTNTVKDFIIHTPPAIQMNENLHDILKIFSESENLYYPVVNKKNELAGIISVDTIKNTFLYSDLSDLLVAVDMMEGFSETVTPETSMKDLMAIIRRKNIEYVPVIGDGGDFLGLIESRSVQRLLSRKLLEVNQKIESLG